MELTERNLKTRRNINWPRCCIISRIRQTKAKGEKELNAQCLGRVVENIDTVARWSSSIGDGTSGLLALGSILVIVLYAKRETS